MMFLLLFFKVIFVKYTFKGRVRLLGIFLVISLIISLGGELIVPLAILQSVSGKIENAVSEAESLPEDAPVQNVIKEITDFVNNEVKNSYNRPESVLEIDNFLWQLDYCMLNMLGLDRTHVIIFQGWGSCGQYAVATEYLLSRIGFNTRRARFIDRDHEWAEVQINGTWFIVDPWYIAHSFNNSIIVPAHLLASADAFECSRGVIVLYRNGTQADASIEHGYLKNT
jgi:hypothetical protein